MNHIFMTYLDKKGTGLPQSTKIKYSKYALLSNTKLKNGQKLKFRPKKRTKIVTNFLDTVYKQNGYLFYLANRLNTILFEQFFDEVENFFKKENFLNDKMRLYTPIRIPKKKGGYRTTYAPREDLLELQNRAKYLLERQLYLKEHDAAHAYCQGRDGLSNANMHKFSKHFIKLDFKDFFPSISKNLLESTLRSLYEFAIIDVEEFYIYNNRIKIYRRLMIKYLYYLVELATLEGKLPQGSPLSPKLSNLVMVPFDYAMINEVKSKEFSKTKMIYTRYADDITISSLHPINKSDLIRRIKTILPKNIILNEEKTKYLKNTNRLYITGVKINKDQETTYGHEKTSKLKQDLFKIIVAEVTGQGDTESARVILGQLSYAMQIEPIKFKNILGTYCRKFNIQPQNIYKYLIK